VVSYLENDAFKDHGKLVELAYHLEVGLSKILLAKIDFTNNDVMGVGGEYIHCSGKWKEGEAQDSWSINESEARGSSGYLPLNEAFL
jgi:hypothetical protein